MPDPRTGERLPRWMKQIEARVSALEQANPATIVITDDDEATGPIIGDLGDGKIGFRLYAADGSILWEQSRLL